MIHKPKAFVLTGPRRFWVEMGVQGGFFVSGWTQDVRDRGISNDISTASEVYRTSG